MQYLFLTGATGLVGRYLLRDLLAAGVPVAAMGRPGKGPAAIESIMRMWEEQAGRSLPRPVVIEGDLCLPEVVPALLAFPTQLGLGVRSSGGRTVWKLRQRVRS